MAAERTVSVPLVSVVIVNWNGKGILEECLRSIYSQPFKSFEVVVVDNGSTDGSADAVKKTYPEAVVRENKENLGFARGNNIGIEAASKGSKYILTLNNDTVLDRSFLAELIGAAEASPETVGMWAPKILSMEDNSLIDSVGGLLIYQDGLAKGRGRLEKDDGQYDCPVDAFIPSACAGLYRKKMLAGIGGFDDDFFAYCEDTDLGLRARLAGWEALSVPKAVVFHLYSATGGRYTPFKAYLVERNRVWVAVKNLPMPLLIKGIFYTKWRYLVQVYGIISGKGAGARFAEGFSRFELVSILLRAYFDAFRGLSGMYKKRLRIQRSRKVSISEFGRLLKKYRLRAADLSLKD
ncbi:MAG: glycosyltransferase family 2 protein [Deltaproteobacteria bacterium]